MSNKKWPRLLALLGVLALALSIIPAATAADDPYVVSRNPVNPGLVAGDGVTPFQLYDSAYQYDTLETFAYVSGGGAGGFSPYILCKWELPDMVSGNGGEPAFVDYSDGTAVNPWDDDSLSYADFTGRYPCDLGDDGPEYEDYAYSVIQVRANAHDEPEERRIELWAAVGHPAGINAVSDVFWKIFHPDGTFKFQEHGRSHTREACELLGAVPGSTTLASGSMWWAAHGTEQLSNSVITDSSHGLVALCNEDQLRFWWGWFDLSKHQPCGEYRIEAYATSTGATSQPLTNFIDVICFHEMVLDFEYVNFDLVIPGVDKQVAGNLVWGDGKPSIANIGSGGMNVGVGFSTMYQASVPANQGPKFIDLFDAKIGINSSNLESWDTIVAFDTPSGDQGHQALLAQHKAAVFEHGRDVANNGVYWFSYKDTSTVCANEVFKLDFSIHPGAGIPADDYYGLVEIWTQPDRGSDDNPAFKNPDAIKAPYTCNNDNGIWGGKGKPVTGLAIPYYGANQRTSSGQLNGVG